MAELIAVEHPKRGKLLFIVAAHFIDHGAFPVDDLIMGIGQNIVFGKRVHHGEGQFVVVKAAEIGIQRHIVDGVMHKAHIPFQAETHAAHIGRSRNERESRGLFRNGDSARIIRQYRRVHLAQEVQRMKIGIAALLVRRKLPFPAAVIQIQHGADRINANSVDMKDLKELTGRRDQEALHLVAGIIKNQRPPLSVLRHPSLLAFKER